MQFLTTTERGPREVGRLSIQRDVTETTGELNWDAILTRLRQGRPILTEGLARRAPDLFDGPYFSAALHEEAG